MADFIAQLHYFNLFLVLAASLVAGIWGLVLFFMKRTKTIYRPWRITVVVTAILALLQGIFGVTLVLLGQKPGTGTGLYYLHYVYGGIVALAIPVALTYATSGKNPRRDVLIFSIAALVLFAAGFRAWMTGPLQWP
jgi:heme A synthase